MINKLKQSILLEGGTIYDPYKNKKIKGSLLIQNGFLSFCHPIPHQYSHNVQAGEQQQQLPPLRSIPGPEVMNGVQYQHDQRPNGYRPADRF